ncbi:MAG: hypothetical protein BGO69_02650 [Bacteroidetes bacterium 46-16]|nr:MAG: hypothetical protein BGO69_02650 [Bacteroidetes bacterium 46-16]
MLLFTAVWELSLHYFFVHVFRLESLSTGATGSVAGGQSTKCEQSAQADNTKPGNSTLISILRTGHKLQ